MDQGLCLLPAGKEGRVLDRVLLLGEVIGPEAVRQALEETGCFDARRCGVTGEVIFWAVLAAGVLTDLPIRRVFKYARRLRPGEATPPCSSWCLARQRLGPASVRRLFTRVVHGWRCAGTRIGDEFGRACRLSSAPGTGPLTTLAPP